MRPSRVGALVSALACLLILAGVLALVGVLPGAGTVPRAAAQSGAGEERPYTDASVPAEDVTMIGATREAPEETWGVGQSGPRTVLVRYVQGNGWSLGPALPEGFELGKSPLAGQVNPQGDGVLAGTVPAEKGTDQALLVGKGGTFVDRPVPTEGETLKAGEEPLLKSGEKLFGVDRAPLIVPLEGEGAEAGALLVPVREGAGVENHVLRWDGRKWTSEPIEVPKASTGDFRVLGIGATSPTNAWLLAQLSSKEGAYPAGAVALFRRVREGEGPGAEWVWKPVTVAGNSEEAEPLTVPVSGAGAPEPFTLAGRGEPPAVIAQTLTVTSEGIWVDGERGDVKAPTTIYFTPEGEAGETRGHVQASWCLLPAGAASAPTCQHELPEGLPSGFDRSIAWDKAEVGGEYGGRVITGFAEGVSLRLEADGAFERVLALGAGPEPNAFPGAQHGAAFSGPHEGWLGAGPMPVHLTEERLESRLQPWPAPFRQPLFALAPAPGAPVAALSSEAIAVGDFGSVARFEPGKGWLPESLFGPGERVEYPRLRAVVWPTSNRIFAVGDSGQMWLWRKETGLWEKDPATPLNFRGNLLGVAFDPQEPAYGFAVGSPGVVYKKIEAGESNELPSCEHEEGTPKKIRPEEREEPGVLLRYGKTWTQEPDSALPPQVQCRASFIAVAFAGSEAIVAYRVRPGGNQKTETGGLLIKNGKEGKWEVDEGAARAMGTGVPVAVAGLPDGGAAFTTVEGENGPQVIERESAGAAWQATPTPLPGLAAGQVALFREGGALRAIVSAGGVANEGQSPEPPEEFPSVLLQPFSPIGGGPESGGVLRQTASGWSDETHELNPAAEPQGGYVYYDLPYRPDPILAVMVNPQGTQGWAVGGDINSNRRLETGDLERYPAEAGVSPLGEGKAQVPLFGDDATFAVGGGSQCATPCADRADARIGPDVWLSNALTRAHEIGVRAFLYTGPRVTTAATQGPKTQPIPFTRELERYAQILGTSQLPVYAAISPYELNARPESNGSEATFQSDFAGFPQTSLSAPDSAEQGCDGTVGCQTAYYSFLSEGPGGDVQAIVLDDSSDVDSAQLAWLERELANARASATPAIVMGNADLNAQIREGDTAAAAVAQVLIADGASAYFYDAPEENIQQPLDGSEVPSFGSGTLGYVNVATESFGDFHGASGFLLGQVDVAARNPSTNRAPVTVRLIPNIGELALEAKEGTLLRRSEPALFDGLARRPRAGGRAVNGGEANEVDPYIPIPEECVGSECASAILPEYTFTSSDPEIGAFVRHNTAAANNPEAVLQNATGEPIHDEPTPAEPIPREESGLFCAFNSGTTIVTIEAGGLKSSLPVTVQAGSVRQPCGTVHLNRLATAAASASEPVLPPAPAPAPAGPTPSGAPPVVPVPPPPPAVAAPLPPARPTPPTPAPFFLPVVPVAPLLAFVPPPVPTPARPTPPSGTSAVTSPVEMAEHEEEEEQATESVSNQAVAYHAPEHEPSPVYILGLVLLAAFAGASTMRRRPRRGRRAVKVAPATLTTTRGQRRMSRDVR